MARPDEPQPDRLTGLPPGVRPGPLGGRFVAYLIDHLVPALIALVTLVLPSRGAGEASTGVTVVGLVLIGLWGLLAWWLLATRAASPGMLAMKLQLVGFTDGRPVGWGRALLRSVVLWVVTVTVVGLLAMLVLLLRHPRHQGWHDRTANAVVIVRRKLAPRRPRSTPPAEQVAPSQARQVTAAPAPAPAQPAAPAQPPAPAPVGRSAVPGPGGPTPAHVASTAASAPSVAVQADTGRPGAVALRPERSAGPDTDPGATRARPSVLQRPAVDSRWEVVLDDGRQIKINGLVVLGRRPEARPGEEAAQLIKLADETRTVSKSHLSLDLEDGGLVVTDRGSTNGSRVTPPGGEPQRCTPWEPVRLQPGSMVSMGDHWLKVQQG